MKAKITKTQMDEGKHSAIYVGRHCSGDFAIGSMDNDKIIIIDENASLDLVYIGDVLIVMAGWDFIKCSPITNIIEQSENKLVVKTQTSTYEIERIKEQ